MRITDFPTPQELRKISHRCLLDGPENPYDKAIRNLYKRIEERHLLGGSEMRIHMDTIIGRPCALYEVIQLEKNICSLLESKGYTVGLRHFHMDDKTDRYYYISWKEE